MAELRLLIPQLEAALQSFKTSGSKFLVLTTINPTPYQPKTLYVLDSSFNPPTKAHLAIASSALAESKSPHPRPFRLLVLFSIHNADKAPSPASFAERIALMTSFANDVSTELYKSPKLKLAENDANVSIDIGLTTEPYYTDKSIAIAETRPLFYAPLVNQVHLVGFDTLVRFCDPKYYPKSSPPLSALAPYFDAGHSLRVTLRPHDEKDESSKKYGSIEEQKKYVQELRDGKLEKEGFLKKWSDRIEITEGGASVGISSTMARKAAQAGDWDAIRKLCPGGVSERLEEWELYKEDSSDK
ncbi:hypothetical protein B0J11DRAFT_529058 [Dendryphion nanum]|uniref:Nicotinamide-nucleotide adenylyltransferase n=1 Tax=Dendryphion nanum TaxID=256645 RepID=A0A9P9IM99_9PLEO|nr:hypothetical protein B0J11DRAFT_529058 [Dendryphion nanum]